MLWDFILAKLLQLAVFVKRIVQYLCGRTVQGTLRLRFGVASDLGEARCVAVVSRKVLTIRSCSDRQCTVILK
jgi:hypothetical protein